MYRRPDSAALRRPPRSPSTPRLFILTVTTVVSRFTLQIDQSETRVPEHGSLIVHNVIVFEYMNTNYPVYISCSADVVLTIDYKECRINQTIVYICNQLKRHNNINLTCIT